MTAPRRHVAPYLALLINRGWTVEQLANRLCLDVRTVRNCQGNQTMGGRRAATLQQLVADHTAPPAATSITLPNGATITAVAAPEGTRGCAHNVEI